MKCSRPFPEIAVTHGGIFHADDVFAYAFLKVINEALELHRTNDPAELVRGLEQSGDYRNTVVFDIGGGEFDHHTDETKEIRPKPDGYEELLEDRPYASFGKIVRAYYDYLMSDDEYDHFDRLLCVPIDRSDCTGEPNTLSNAISCFNGFWDESNDPDRQLDRFKEAAEFATIIIRRNIHKVKAATDADAITTATALDTLDAHPTTHFMVLRNYTEYTHAIQQFQSIAWVIYPSLRSGYQLFSVRDMKTGKNRDLIPDDMYNAIMLSPNALFVHPDRFTAVFKTMDAALIWAKSLSRTYEQRHMTA